jgi:hypothetical protein
VVLSLYISFFPPVNVQLGGGGDKVVVLSCLELQCVRHRGEGPEGDREESENNIINIGKKY